MANTPYTNPDLSGFALPDIEKVSIGNTPALWGMAGNPMEASYENIMKAINKTGEIPGMMQTAMPSIASILSPEGQAVSPYASAIKTQTAESEAKVQTDMMKRGLTGSDIEAGAMGQARAAGQTALANMYGQTANQLSQMIYQAVSGDINTNRELLLTLAQAMGQELTSQRDMEQFRMALQASMDQANAMASAQKQASWMKLGGSVLGAAGTIGAGYFGGPAFAASQEAARQEAARKAAREGAR